MKKPSLDKPVWRLLDTGLCSGAENMAYDAALLRARAEGKSPNTVRFLQFSPPVALVGYHQSIAEEIREEYCRQAGIEINRRITGGGAIYFDEGQIGWELICSYKDLGLGLNMERITTAICEAAAQALRAYGVKAEFRPRNDLEVDGRKISGTGGSFDGDCFLFQGTLLIDFNLENLIKALRIPTEKLNRKELSSARDRVVSLSELLGYTPPAQEIKAALAESFGGIFGFETETGGLTRYERELFREELQHVTSDAWIIGDRLPKIRQKVFRSIHKEDGGLIRVSAKVDVDRLVLRDILITGDFFMRPQRALFDLEAALKNKPLDELERTVRDFFSTENVDLMVLTPDDFVRAIGMAVEKHQYTRYGLTIDEANSLTCLNGEIEDTLKSCDLLLLPYCSKLLECPLRYKDGCVKCGKCDIGVAWELGEKAHLRIKTIQNYEHLVEELNMERKAGTRAYVGCCCEAFMVKRQEAFKKSGLPGLLIDIDSTTCYELKMEEDAYRGEFRHQTNLKLDILKKVLDHIGRVREPQSQRYAS